MQRTLRISHRDTETFLLCVLVSPWLISSVTCVISVSRLS
jgi:hypothetical protein